MTYEQYRTELEETYLYEAELWQRMVEGGLADPDMFEPTPVEQQLADLDPNNIPF